MTELPPPGRRIALRYRDDSGPRELIGYVRSVDPEGLSMLDRTLAPRLLAWQTLESWRAVPQVPRGRNPLTADRALLDRMAADGRLAAPEDDAPDAHPSVRDEECLVARLADLLGPDVPDQPPEAYDLGDSIAARDLAGVQGRALVVGEWATIRLTTAQQGRTAASSVPDAGAGHSSESDAELDVVHALARWAAYRDARNLQVRGARSALAGLTAVSCR
ncbi:hypothetical protein GA0111570_101321 [Raineyella antarctica]|uniref:Uncharacterized protein n=1 Tax=Raineyella antarctica TaxID=1577474 RepID=A0A1G6GDH5_9ACTN|nr:hypothetical protein [Raineyella antarctica]SDB80047.1 hypothetical protein GA0111570_101321 [Raineyella antarctica]